MKNKFIALSLLIPTFLVGCSSRGTNESSAPKEDSSSTSSIESESSNVSLEESSVASQEESSNTSEPFVSVSSVSLNESSLEIDLEDSSTLLIATVLPENATNKAVTWSSSNPSVATVNEGNIIPVAEGTTLITVKTLDGNKTAECSVTIKKTITIPNYVMHGLYSGETDWTDKPMVINPYSTTEYMIQGVSLHENDVFKIHMYGDTWYGYSSIKSSVKSGLVTSAGSDDNIKVLTTGVYDIYCDYNVSDGGHIYLSRTDETTPPPSVVSVSGISLSHTGKYLLVRNELVLTATVYPENAANKQVYWSSSDTNIATVSSGGRVVAKEKRGSTTIKAITADGNFSATCIVYVSPSQYPDYCLTGTVGGKTQSYINLKYAAIPLSTGEYLIPDVELVEGDEITVTNSSGARLKDKYNQIYKKTISKNMSVNAYLNINAENKDYLSFETKTNS